MVRRFQRDFVFNRFDGPSRGPEVSGSKAAGAIRVLVQGDSITWGQGVKSEESLYTTRLLRKLRAVDPGFEMAVLAKPGREIDGHLGQIRKWGDRLQPDLIVYQWYVNDVELDHQGRPAKTLPWRRFFLHNLLTHSSYLYFFLDYQASVFWPSSGPSYSDYIVTEYRVGSSGWRRFEDEFRSWVKEATSLTPRILIALYPYIRAPSDSPVEKIYDQVRNLSAELGVETIDLIESLTEFQEDYSRTYASPFDAHPSAEVHRLMAKALYGRVQVSWPELIASGRSP